MMNRHERRRRSPNAELQQKVLLRAIWPDAYSVSGGGHGNAARATLKRKTRRVRNGGSPFKCLSRDVSSQRDAIAGEGNRTLVISLEGSQQPSDIKTYSDIAFRFAPLSRNRFFPLSTSHDLRLEGEGDAE
jgi:hypothetical protein